MKKLLLIIVVVFLFVSCSKKDYLEQVYDKKLLNEPKQCLKLELEPYSIKVQKLAKDHFVFSNQCEWIVKIRYKTKIGCNSPFGVEQKSFSHKDAFIEFSLKKNQKTIYLIYQDVNTKEFDNRFIEMFNYFKNKAHL